MNSPRNINGKFLRKKIDLHSSFSSSSYRFCTSLFHHKKFTYEQFHLEYCFVKADLIKAEASLCEIQFYRRPFAFIYFTLCRTSEQLRIVLDEYAKIKQRDKGVYRHLFVRYQTEEEEEDEDGGEDEDDDDINSQS